MKFMGTSANDSFFGSKNPDQIQGAGGEDILSGDGGADIIAGYLFGSTDYVQDILDGGSGSDQLYIGVDDIALGGDGSDTFYIAGSLSPKRIDGGTGTDKLVLVGTNNISGAIIENIEWLLLPSPSGPQMTADQLAKFEVIGSSGFTQAVGFRLSAGGIANSIKVVNTQALQIIGSNDAETLGLIAGSEVKLEYKGLFGTDVVHGANGVDKLEGNQDSDSLFGGGAGDVIAGYSISSVELVGNFLSGEAGDDTLYVGPNDSAHGGADNDRILMGGSLAPKVLDGGSGEDTLVLKSVNNISGADLKGIEQLEAEGTGGGPQLTATQLNEFETVAPIGPAKAVELRLSEGGYAAIIPSSDLKALTIFGSHEGDHVALAAQALTTLQFRGLDGNDTAHGGSGQDELEGNQGADLLLGGDGGDSIGGNTLDAAGDGFIDILKGGEGNDVLYAGTLDRVYGEAGDDFFFIRGNNPQRLDGGVGNDGLGLTPNSDISSATLVSIETLVAPVTNGVHGRLTANQLDEFQIVAGGHKNNAVLELTPGAGRADNILTDPDLSSLTILGSSANDNIGLNPNSNALFNFFGRSGNDVVLGNSLPNELHGGVGNDSLQGGTASDLMDGGTGSDYAVFQLLDQHVEVDLRLPENEPQDTKGGGLDRFISIENLSGTRFGDKLTGNDAANVIEGGADYNLQFDILDGGAGQDTVSYEHATLAVSLDLAFSGKQNTGGGGEDQLSNFENALGGAGDDGMTGDSGDNLLKGNGGNDLLDGAAGDDRLIGDDGKDILLGSAGNDVLSGLAGDDQMFGQAGIDRLRGGSGADTFGARPGDGMEIIVDFEDGIDKLYFQGFGNAFDTPQEVLARGVEGTNGVSFTLPNPGGGNTIVQVLESSIGNFDASDFVVLA